MSLDTTNFDCTDIGANPVTLTATDNNGNINTNAAIVTVRDNIAPTVITQNLTVQLDEFGAAVISTNDVDNGSFDNCSVLSMDLDKTTFDCSDLGLNTITLSVSDGGGNMVTETAVITVEDSTDPTAIAKDISVQLGASGSVFISPEDIDDGSTDNCGIVSLSLNVNEFNCDDIGANNITLSITDASGNISTATAIVTVEENLIVEAISKDIVVSLNADGFVNITPEDINNGSGGGCSSTIELDQTTFDCSNLGENTVTLTVSTASNSDSTTATVTVVDEIAPVFDINTLPVDQSVTYNSSTDSAYIIEDFTTDVIAEDNCNAFSNVITQTPAAGTELGEGDHIITLTATDSTGNSVSYTFMISVSDILSTEENFIPDLSIYPIPTSGKVYITKSVKEYRLYNIAGQKIKQGSGNEIDLKDLQSGVYFAHLFTDRGNDVFRLIRE